MLNVYFLKYFIAFFLLFIASLSHGKYKIGNYPTMKRNEKKKKRNPEKKKMMNRKLYGTNLWVNSIQTKTKKREIVFSPFTFTIQYSAYLFGGQHKVLFHTHTHSISFCAFCMSMLFHISKTNKKGDFFNCDGIFFASHWCTIELVKLWKQTAIDREKGMLENEWE